ncbi:hypothetical protein BDN72DRAFT_197104 [Pluteus cervinus]|uniref:Uncharacterized protein n=1 Tax=Pluteus cervinus TaxID=181527 RepID=A0ACD3AHQ2_9AGAR|nr:hypothetical protein BDN72DRAFT_197104 [Pluteus cervinus]
MNSPRQITSTEGLVLFLYSRGRAGISSITRFRPAEQNSTIYLQALFAAFKLLMVTSKTLSPHIMHPCFRFFRRISFVFPIRAGPLVRWICRADFGHPLPNALRNIYSQSRARLVLPSTTFNSIAIPQGYLIAHIKNSSYLLSTSQCSSPHDLRLQDTILSRKPALIKRYSQYLKIKSKD